MNYEKEQKILREAKDRLRKAMDEDEENRRLAKDDLEFVAVDGKQWPEGIKAEREAEGRPCITVNKMPIYIDQVVGDQRMNRPSIKVIPVDAQAQNRTAEILGGWIKHVQQISKSDVAVDHGFEHAVACGYGAWRVVTRYTSDSAFEQEAFIEKIDNALSVFWGKHIEYDCSDAMYCFIVSDMDKEEFKAKYNVEPVQFNSSGDQFLEGWATKNTVRLAEYFVKEPVKKTIYLLEDNRTVNELAEGDVVVRKRTVETYKIMWYLLTGDKVIDSREWLGKKYIPIIPMWGKEFNVAGKRRIRGLIRNAKDPQRMYNYWVSIDTETIALQPKSPYILTPKQVEGHESQWLDAHKKNFPYLLANADKDAPGWPHREAPPQASSALVQKIAMTDQEMRDTVGLQKASLGMQSNERSGAAIRERQKEGDVGTFAFIDNLSRSLEHTGRILVDIAPVLLDTERIVRLGLDTGDYEFTTVNLEAPDGKIINDLSLGTYDVTVTVGPSFTTQRSEARQSMQEFIQYYPAAAPVIGDLYAKSMDWPGAEQVAKRLAFLLPPEIKAQQEAEDAKRNGQPSPQPVQQQPPPPDPVQTLKVQEEQLKLQEMQIKLEQENVKLEGLKIKNELMIKSSKEDIKKMMDEIDQEDESMTEETPTQSTQSAPSVVNLPARASGGDVEAGQPYVVGELGPEVMVPKESGSIVPNRMLSPAVQNGAQVRAGSVGMSHNDISGNTPEQTRGFVTPEGGFVGREDAASWMESNRPDVYSTLPTSAKTSLHSEDLVPPVIYKPLA